MNVSLHEMRLDCYEASYSGTRIVELSGETVVSDKMPDIGLLGETGAQVLLRSKRTDHGLGMMEGELCVSVGYIPDGAGGLCKIELLLPWQMAFEAESISDDDLAVGDVQITELETRMLNPRKVLVKAKLTVEMSCYGKKTVTVSSGAEENSALQVLTNTADCCVVSAICEKSFAVTDEYVLGDSLQGCEVLHRAVSFRMDDVKTLANKLIVKGCVLTDAVVMGKSGSTEKVRFNSGFSFIAETDCETVSSNIQTVFLPTAIFLDVSADGRLLTLELHGVCQMLSYETKSLSYVADAFSNFHEIKTETERQTVYESVKTERRRCTETVALSCRDRSAKVLFATGDCCVSGSGRVLCRLSVCVEYESGAVDWLKKQTSVAYGLKDGERLLGAHIADLYCTVEPGEIQLRITVEGDVMEAPPMELQWISGVEQGAPMAPAKDVSLTVVRTKGKLWELAKAYGSTVELISHCNDVMEDEITQEMLLLIPKQYLL